MYICLSLYVKFGTTIRIARGFGDPHLITLDGYMYTFNGKGEFTLVETVGGGVTLQGRMVEAQTGNGSNQTVNAGTVFAAFVARESDSDTVQFELDQQGLVALVNGETLDFGMLLSQRFANVTVSDKGNSTLSADFTRGTSIQVTERNGIISDILITVSNEYFNRTRGLLGQFNRDSSDDLRPANNSVPLPLNSSLEMIHYQFGLTCEFMTTIKSTLRRLCFSFLANFL